MTSEKCKGCNHSMSFHFPNVVGEVSCLVLETKVTWTSSVHYCDCVNYISPSRKYQEEQREKENKRLQDIIAVIAQRMIKE